MSPVASIHSADRDFGVDLPVWDIPTVLAIFGSAWCANDLWDASRDPAPLACSAVLRRMDTLGYTERAMEVDFTRLHDAWAADLDQIYGSLSASDELKQLFAGGSARYLRPALTEAMALLADQLVGYLIDEHDHYPDESTVIRIALWPFNPAERIYVSISQQAIFDLTPNDVAWHEDEYPHPSSLASFRNRMAWRNTKPILLLEGRYDTEILRTAFELRGSEMADCISIADFTEGTDGGTGGLRKILRTLAHLKIPNTIVGLFDNDAAGHEAITLLGRDKLPSSIGYATYPDLELARAYPTIGPSGVVDLDINGSAVSIEHFLGADCLAGDSGFTPIEWTGYNRRIGRYQGALLNKVGVQKRFASKVRRARTGNALAADDWASLDQLLAFVVDKVGRVTNGRQ